MLPSALASSGGNHGGGQYGGWVGQHGGWGGHIIAAAITVGGYHSGGSVDVPELDGPAGVLAASLLVSLLFFVREKIRRKK